MQTPPGKCKQTISLNFLTLDTSKNICNKLSCRVVFFFVFFFPFLSFLTQRLSEANRLSVQDNHNKLLLFFSSSPSSLSSCSPPIPSPYFTFSNVSITAGHKPPCCACVCVRVQEGEKERLRRITSKISPAFYAQMSSLSLPLSPPSHVASSNQWCWHCRRALSFGGKRLFSHWERCSWTLDA